MSEDNIMVYQGREVIIKHLPREKFDTLVLDAKRILGQAPFRFCAERWDYPGPQPAKKGSDNFNYATRILALEWPIVRIFHQDIMKIVSLSDLGEANGRT